MDDLAWEEEGDAGVQSLKRERDEEAPVDECLSMPLLILGGRMDLPHTEEGRRAGWGVTGLEKAGCKGLGLQRAACVLDCQGMKIIILLGLGNQARRRMGRTHCSCKGPHPGSRPPWVMQASQDGTRRVSDSEGDSAQD